MHHTGPPTDRDFSAKEIAHYHADTLGWPGIGYHFLAHAEGSIDYVGDMLTVRYHVGLLNYSSVGICIPGDFRAHWPYDKALEAARKLIAWLRQEIPGVEVVGHTDVSHLTGHGYTECPGVSTWPQWRGEVGA